MRTARDQHDRNRHRQAARAVLCALGLSLLAGCPADGDGPPVPGEPIWLDGETGAIEAERLSESGADAVGVGAPYDVVWTASNTLYRQPAEGTPAAVGLTDGSLRSIVQWRGSSLVAAGSQLSVLEPAGLDDSPLNQAMVDAPTSLAATADGLILVAGGKGYRLHLGALLRFEHDEAVTHVAGPARFDDRDAFWLCGEQGGVQIVNSTDGFFEVSRLPEAKYCRTDAEGAMWTTADGYVLKIADDTVAYTSDADFTDVVASPLSNVAWAIAGDTVFAIEGERVRRLTVPDIVDRTSATVDAAGRLLFSSGGAVIRLTAGERLLMLGLPDGALSYPADISFVVAPSSAVATEYTVTVDGDTLGVSNGRAVLDPAAFGAQSVVLRAEVELEGGGKAVGEQTIELAPLTASSWNDDVLPIYDTHCKRCHDGASATVLKGPDIWQERLLDILGYVQSGAMPLGSEPLTALEVATIRAWGDFGFSP